MKEVERIASSNLMPAYLKRKQFIADSTRAYYYFNLRKDSSYIKKYLNRRSASIQKTKQNNINITTNKNNNVKKQQPQTAIIKQPFYLKKNNNGDNILFCKKDIFFVDDKHLKKQIAV
jgi:penicillin-binding protein 2